MSLADFTPETHTIKTRRGSLVVRGLNLADIGQLVSAHLPELEAAFSLFGKRTPAGAGQMDLLVLSLARDFPGLAASVIAAACDEPDGRDAARALPFPVQVEALSHIGRLTFEDVGGLEPFLRTLTSLVAGLGIAVPSPGSPAAAVGVETKAA